MIENGTTVQGDLKNLKGKPAWGLARTVGSMFFLELGEGIQRVEQKKPHGEWHFLVQMCQWRIETSHAIIVGSEDDQEFIDATLARAELGVVTDAITQPPSYDLSLTFTSGIQLKTFCASAAAREDWNNWYLYLPNGNVWTVDGRVRLALYSPTNGGSAAEGMPSKR
jgi:hypothetical protein